MLSNEARPKWQDDYRDELRRTANLEARFEKRGGQWWTMRVSPEYTPRAVRRTDVERFTLALRQRPDYEMPTE